MIKKLLFCVLTIVVLASKSQINVPYPYVIPNIDWINYHSQRDAIGSMPTSLDANSNVYLTGYSGSSGSATIIALKYDSTGNTIFVYNYFNTGYNSGRAIKVDASGNSFIAGVTQDGTTGFDYFIAKLSPLGVQQWVTTFDGGFGGSIDEAEDICFDSGGDVYVTGRSQNSNGDYDIITLKLDGSTGSQIWQHTFNGASSLDDEANAMTISTNGARLYITGFSTDVSNGKDIVTFAIDASTGASSWGPTFTDGTSNADDVGNAIILLGTDVVVCGEINNTSTGNDAVTIKYNGGSGSIIFQEEYDAYSGSNNRATALARDSTGNIGVVGTAQNGTLFEYHTILYSNSGVQYGLNKETTNLTSPSVDPKICNDTIAHHWYVSGERLNATKDILAYQISPSGNTAWEKHIDGQTNDVDCATGIAVNGIGVVFVGAISKNAGSNFDLTTVKINQTPVYFPPDITSNEKPDPNHLFYENKGQVVNDTNGQVVSEVLFNTYGLYPNEFFRASGITYKFFSEDTIANNNDTIQRIDFEMIETNPFSIAYPFEPRHGKLSFMYEGLPDAVVGVQGYERYIVPNIYPYIDLHYYSNSNGLKMYYVVKPGANPNAILLQVNGASSTTITSGKLLINGFNSKSKIIYEQPQVYSVNNIGQAISLTTTIAWQSLGSDMYKLNVSSYNSSWPLIIQLNQGNNLNPPSSSVANLVHSTYYGGFASEGIRAIKVDEGNGNFVTLHDVAVSSHSLTFPVISGTMVSVNTQTNNNSGLFAVTLFNKDFERLAVNTYGFQGFQMKPLNIAIRNNLITVVGNADVPSPLGTYPLRADLPLYNSTGPLSSGTYTNNKGHGYAIQFEYSPAASSINKIKWATRLNGMAADIATSKDGKSLYILSSTEAYNFTADAQSKSGAYNNSSLPIDNLWYLKISKFDSLGVRNWATIFSAKNRNYGKANTFNFMNNISGLSLQNDTYLKYRISCDNYGFSVAGETDTINLKIYSKYGAPVDSFFNGRTDAFFTRFNKKDSLVYSSYVGGSEDEAYCAISSSGSKESVMVGYSNSQNYQKICTMPAANEYCDTTIFSNYVKMLITKFDTIGNKTWSTYYGSNAGFSNVYAWAVASDNADNIYISGRDLGSFFLSATNPGGMYTTNSRNNTESFMLAFNFKQPYWNTLFGGLREDVSYSMAFNPVNQTVLMAGLCNTNYTTIPNEAPYFPITKNPAIFNAWFQFKLNNMPPVLPLVTSYDGFISQFDLSLMPIGVIEYFNSNKTSEPFELFPNPARNDFNIAFKHKMEGEIKIDIYDEMGRLVHSESRINIVDYSLVSVRTGGLPNGFYVVKVSGANSSFSKKLILSH